MCPDRTVGVDKRVEDTTVSGTAAQGPRLRPELEGIPTYKPGRPASGAEGRTDDPAPGSLISVLWEGTRPLLVEVQSLVVDSQYGTSRRLGLGMDQNRLAMLLAVLTKHGGMVVADQDVFVNVVGGIKISETRADLAVVLAVVSSFRNISLSHHLFAFGEIGLSGEIRPVPNGEARIREAAKHGFRKALVPKANVPKRGIDGMEIVGVCQLGEALEALF